ncbi:hypothetical protein [Streptomyces sp. NPDC002851]
MSMGDGLRADAKVLETEGLHMFEVGQDWAKAVNDLKATLTALEKSDTPPWGDDELGEYFGVAYEGLRDGMYESMGSLAERLAGMGIAFGEMGVRHKKGELAQYEAYQAATSEYDGQVGAEVKSMKSV